MHVYTGLASYVIFSQAIGITVVGSSQCWRNMSIDIGNKGEQYISSELHNQKCFPNHQLFTMTIDMEVNSRCPCLVIFIGTTVFIPSCRIGRVISQGVLCVHGKITNIKRLATEIGTEISNSSSFDVFYQKKRLFNTWLNICNDSTITFSFPSFRQSPTLTAHLFVVLVSVSNFFFLCTF